MTGLLEAVAIGLVKAASAQAGGAALKKLTLLMRGVPTYGRIAPGRLVARASASLLSWKAREGVGDDDLLTGVEAAQQILAHASLPRAADFANGGNAVSIAEGWMRSGGANELTVAGESVCRRMLAEIIEIAMLDPEYRDRFMQDLLIQISRRRLPEDPDGLSLASRSVALWRTDEVVRRVESRRRIDLDGSRWPSFATTLEHSWAAEVDECITRLAQAASGHEARVRLEVQAPRRDETYSSIRRRLLSTEFTDAIDRLRADVRERSNVDRGADLRLRDVESDVRWLRDEAASPTYRIILPIAGSWGSGKTDLGASISSEMLRSGRPTLFVRTANTSLREALLDAASHTFGRAFESIDELADAVRKHYDIVLVAIDDVGGWVTTDPFLASHLRDLVEDLTASRVFRWVVSSDPTGLGHLYSPSHHDFWETYGYRENPPTENRRARIVANGWLNLDDMVVTAGIGTGLIRAGLTDDVGRDFDAIDALTPGTGGSAVHLLARPRPATLLVDVIRRREGGKLLDLLALLTDEYFVAEYWHQAMEALSADAGERERLVSMQRELADYFYAGGGQPVDEEDLRSAVFGRQPDTRELAVAHRLMEGLVAAEFLRRADARLSPSTGILWGKLVVEASGDDLWLTPDRVLLQLKDWHGEIDAERRELAQYVVRARFASLGELPDYLWVIPLVWRRLLREDSDNSALWFAALAVPARSQKELVATAVEWTAQTEESDGVFALFYWCRHAPDGVWSMRDSLRVLSTTYEQVRSRGLAAFLLGAAERALSTGDLSEPAAFATALRYLHGSDESGVGDRLAILFIEHVGGRVGAVMLLTGILEHFRRHEEVIDRLSDRTRRGFDVELLESGINRALATDFRSATNLMLRGVWLKSRNDDLNAALRQSSRTLVGNWYRNERPRVTGLIIELLDGDRSDLEAAFFIVRHTVSTSGHAEVVVDLKLSFAVEAFDRRIDEFRPAVRKRWVEPFLRVNLSRA